MGLLGISAEQHVAVEAIIQDMPDDGWIKPRRGYEYEIGEMVTRI
ncbi:MAG TPA: hypothetical protein VEI57_16480 [Nitrospirota bacterium]|nr:hypothetical protein [Nitrospirota bacterium]